MPEENQTPYRVLALKYRPQSFDELIGQDALVRTLTNAIESQRIANAYMLTGVRGVGKTTTARIIAKALNYKGADGTAEPTTGPTDDCPLCQAITEDRHPDVIEMDAASRTGVDDIREILDGVRYAPTEARYKIYIIDEVHMLSKQAFNALLKTLEEPPEHVKFIFATTEIRKVPITVLSRCQRFDLRRVDIETLKEHFSNICNKENVEAEDEALSIIARAADGSVRDGLSLLDQAISLSGEKVSAQQVQDMLGLADRTRNIDLLEYVLTGKLQDALDLMDELYKSGADPLTMLQDLQEVTHILTRVRAVPKAAEFSGSMTGDQLKRLQEMAAKLSMPTLGRTWQILLKGASEVQMAANSQQAAEMVLIRLAYAADLPDPKDIMKKLKEGSVSSASMQNGSSPSSGPAVQVSALQQSGSGHTQALAMPQPLKEPEKEMETALWIDPLTSLEEIVLMLEQKSEVLLAAQVREYIHLVKLEKGRIEFRLAENAPQAIPQSLTKALRTHTGDHWMVSVVGEQGEATLAEQKKKRWLKQVEKIKQDPMVAEVLSIFPDAEITAITEPQGEKTT